MEELCAGWDGGKVGQEWGGPDVGAEVVRPRRGRRSGAVMLFEQGDFIEMDSNPTVGHEPQKLRPALVVSVGHFNNVASSLAVVCPITSTVNGHPLHVELPDGCVVSGCVCVEALRELASAA